MPDKPLDPADDGGMETPSKSARKRESTALQKLGEQLVGLSERQLESVPLDGAPQLLQAVREARGIKSHSARRRHLQWIGRLMRDVDPEPIRQSLENLHRERQEAAREFHELEAVRDRLIARGPDALDEVVDRFPDADRQHLRQLLRQHQREQARNQPPAAARKLFRYLRSLDES